MKKFILAAAVLATLVVPAAASANVERYQEQTATFTVEQPRGQVGQFNDVWKHDFKVKVNPCDGTFIGKGNVTDGQSDSVAWSESITGSFDDDTVSFDTVPNAGATFRVTDAPYNTKVIVEPPGRRTHRDQGVGSEIQEHERLQEPRPVRQGQGGGSDAAHSCIGMPVNSSK